MGFLGDILGGVSDIFGIGGGNSVSKEARNMNRELYGWNATQGADFRNMDPTLSAERVGADQVGAERIGADQVNAQTIGTAQQGQSRMFDASPTGQNAQEDLLAKYLNTTNQGGMDAIMRADIGDANRLSQQNSQQISNSIEQNARRSSPGATGAGGVTGALQMLAGQGQADQAATSADHAAAAAQGRNMQAMSQGGALAGQLREQNFMPLEAQDVINRYNTGIQQSAMEGNVANNLRAQMSNQGANLQAGMANQSTGLHAALANQAANLNASQFNSNQGMRAQQGMFDNRMQMGYGNLNALRGAGGATSGLGYSGQNMTNTANRGFSGIGSGIDEGISAYLGKK
jgi:hypothetical protein